MTQPFYWTDEPDLGVRSLVESREFGGRYAMRLDHLEDGTFALVIGRINAPVARPCSSTFVSHDIRKLRAFASLVVTYGPDADIPDGVEEILTRSVGMAIAKCTLIAAVIIAAIAAGVGLAKSEQTETGYDIGKANAIYDACSPIVSFNDSYFQDRVKFRDDAKFREAITRGYHENTHDLTLAQCKVHGVNNRYLS